MRRILNLIVREDRLKGSEIASFCIHQKRWQIAAEILGNACILLYVAQLVSFLAHLADPNLPLEFSLLLVGIAAGFISNSRQIRFYEKGLLIPKAGAYVFLSREQLVGMKTDGSDFVVIGSDATWGGPYSGGRFRVRASDLPRLVDVLARFTHTCGASSG